MKVGVLMSGANLIKTLFVSYESVSSSAVTNVIFRA